MSLLEAFIPQLREEADRLEKANEEYRAGRADIGEVGPGGKMTSMKAQVMAQNERAIKANRDLIARYEAGER